MESTFEVIDVANPENCHTRGKRCNANNKVNESILASHFQIISFLIRQ